MTLTLGSVGATYGGLTGKSGKDFGHGTGRYVTFTEVMSASRLIGRSLERVNVHRYERQHEVRRGDVLFNGSSETPEEVALGAVVDFDVPRGVYLNSFCFGYRLTQPNEVDPTYLAYFFRSAVGRDIVFGLAQGATRYNIAKTKLLKTPLDVPSYEQQKAIAATLSQVDDVIASLERLIAKKRAVKQGMMQELLTGRTRLPGFSDPWQSGYLGDLYHRHSEAIDPRRAKARLFQHFSLPAFDAGRVARVERGSLIDSIKFTVPSDAVLVSKLNPRISRVWVPSDVSDSALASTEFIVMVPGPHVDRRFLGWLVSSQQVSSGMKLLATGTTKSHVRVSPSQVAGIAVRWPAYEEQVAICSVLDDVASEIEALERRLEATRDIKQGMMQELLTGRTRLPVDEEVAV